MLILAFSGSSCGSKQEIIAPKATFEDEINRLANSPYGKLIDEVPVGYKPAFDAQQLNYDKVYLFKTNDGKISEFYKIKAGESPKVNNVNTRTWSGWKYASVKNAYGWTGTCNGTGIDCGISDGKWVWFWSTN